MKKNTVRIAWFGVFTALALIFSYVETLIPFQIGIPGVKLGLANLIVVVALYKMGGKDAMLLSVTRIVLSGFIFASLFSILYSLAGGLLSLAVMVILKKRGSFSVFGVSMAGGVFHNVGQLIVAMLVVETFSVAYYVPVLLIAGVIEKLYLSGPAAASPAFMRGVVQKLKCPEMRPVVLNPDPVHTPAFMATDLRQSLLCSTDA